MKLVPALLLLVLASCAGTSAADGVFPVRGAREDRPRLRYRDGQVSANDTCMIRVENRLNPRIPPMYVNGRPVGFC